MVVIKKTLILWTIVLTETHTYCIAIFICSINRQDLIVAKGPGTGKLGLPALCVLFLFILHHIYLFTNLPFLTDPDCSAVTVYKPGGSRETSASGPWVSDLSLPVMS